ncbi:Uncharacterized protein, contains a NRPS condensation (elongation) domain [Anaerovirgula multivorans]|uniref:Uncharacterized protein, contains a NRPS condensation (Elongation) domain n=1 Tax=Anaerovirgula multivorans TaxID=312168 RepID=A0A239JI34_9FIRM|nr:hypothetical protein [Anaerovirgula multivorans]SNT04394.1 Uncharacterized protein, contains a NRPS condensation (elongation) domain [Anaerovirgula multivorans]
MKKKIHRGTALDLIQTAYMESHVPLVYCYMVLDKAVDVSRLKQAVRSTAEIVPQILCRYNGVKNTWLPAKYDSNSIVKIVSDKNCYEDLIWDLHTGPQLKINIYRQGAGDSLSIAMSHILTDGAGFQQYLALLCEFYNEQNSQAVSEVNSRSVIPLLFHTAIQRLPYIIKHVDKGNIPEILPIEQGQTLLNSLKVTLSEEQLKMVQKKARNLHVTLNDVFMASFAYSLKSFTTQDEIILPCPADLRKFGTQNRKLTIANMTGKYLCRISLGKDERLKEMTLAVHQEMERQKSHYDCFHFILFLQILHAILPANLLSRITKSLYSVEPISYTNMGTIDEKIFFQEITIKECYLCGTYRQAPSFQVSISTYLQERLHTGCKYVRYRKAKNYWNENIK